MNKTLKAIIATRKQVEAEAREGKKCHNWSPDKCPLCEEFADSCSRCIFNIENSKGDCVHFFRYFMNVTLCVYSTPIEYILSFLIDLEDCYQRIENEKA